jgi:hypothetical protein
MIRPLHLRLCLIAVFQALWMLPTLGQWVTQTNTLRSGWNAVYLHVDPSHSTVNNLMSSVTNVSEIWMWTPTSPQQFIDSPQTPTGAATQWTRWTRTLGTNSPLQRFAPNTAYFFKVAGTNTATTNLWAIKGRPMSPQYQWTSSGLNFIGFPVPAAGVTYESFFLPVPSLLEVSEIYRTIGIDFGTNNPVRVSNFAGNQLRRGEAVWMRVSSGYNRYFGSFEIDLTGSRTISFGSSATQISFRLRNQLATTNTITMTLAPSEAPPTGQTNIVGVPPLLVRGALEPSTLTYYHQTLATNETATWTLPPRGRPGSDVQVVIGLSRNQLTGSPGDLSAGVLQLTDSAGLLRVDVGVSAVKSPRAGLWVGDAQVTQVVEYLTTFERDPVGRPVVRLTGTDGAYSVLFTNSVPSSVSRPFPLRLIVHDDGTNIHLLQRVFIGLDNFANPTVATRQDLLSQSSLSSARRISAAHLPWSANNTPWAMTITSNVYQASITTAFDQSGINPFIHQYHPDHDNLNATFTSTLPKGNESYGITRTIWLSPQTSGSDFRSLTLGALDRNGVYDETITLEGSGSNTRTFRVIGTFNLNRISDIPVLTR